ncbi:unnamed protein product, partial [Allacma fusca]
MKNPVRETLPIFMVLAPLLLLTSLPGASTTPEDLQKARDDTKTRLQDRIPGLPVDDSDDFVLMGPDNNKGTQSNESKFRQGQLSTSSFNISFDADTKDTKNE